MKTIKVSGETLQVIKDLQSARDNKNVASKAEKEAKARLENAIMAEGAFALMFNGKVVATQTESNRRTIDSELLQRLYPEAYQACSHDTTVLTLKVTI